MYFRNWLFSFVLKQQQFFPRFVFYVTPKRQTKMPPPSIGNPGPGPSLVAGGATYQAAEKLPESRDVVKKRQRDDATEIGGADYFVGYNNGRQLAFRVPAKDFLTSGTSGNYVLVSGGTMTGPLGLYAGSTCPAPDTNFEIANKAYVDASGTNKYVPFQGGEMTGGLALFAGSTAPDPTSNLQVANKEYVDGKIGTVGSIQTFTPAMYVNSTAVTSYDSSSPLIGYMIMEPLSGMTPNVSRCTLQVSISGMTLANAAGTLNMPFGSANPTLPFPLISSFMALTNVATGSFTIFSTIGTSTNAPAQVGQSVLQWGTSSSAAVVVFAYWNRSLNGGLGSYAYIDQAVVNVGNTQTTFTISYLCATP